MKLVSKVKTLKKKVKGNLKKNKFIREKFRGSGEYHIIGSFP